MKPLSLWFNAVGLAVALWVPTRAAEPAPASSAPVRVGVYDSRAVAYAHFWSADEQRRRDAVIAEGRAAKAAGNTAVFKERSRAMADDQRIHEEVFSDASRHGSDGGARRETARASRGAGRRPPGIEVG